MAFGGQVLDNPISGERITFRKTAADTDGDLLVIDLELSPDGHVPGAHAHPLQEERFQVTQGTMKFRRGARTLTVRAGDRVVVPHGTVHRFENTGDAPAHVRVEVQAGPEDGRAVRNHGCTRPRGADHGSGMPYPLELALFMSESMPRSALRCCPRSPYVRSRPRLSGWLDAENSIRATGSRCLAHPIRGVIRGGHRAVATARPATPGKQPVRRLGDRNARPHETLR